jgi:hypothetical protein
VEEKILKDPNRRGVFAQHAKAVALGRNIKRDASEELFRSNTPPYKISGPDFDLKNPRSTPPDL